MNNNFLNSFIQHNDLAVVLKDYITNAIKKSQRFDSPSFMTIIRGMQLAR